ncbi:MAG TPA: hypothetical protein VHA05_02065 [Candidatus Saccharimonadales bacterium]|nr:hypothetical protein [Candidatus Saccharimonadales bacterium]
MDFTTRGASAHPSAPSPSSGTAAPAGASKKKRDRGKWSRVGVTAIVGAVIILIIALVVFISFSGNKSEDSYVDTSKLQAVFLNTGQVYFGNIKSLNNKYFVLTNIYYLQQTNNGSNNSSSSSNAGNNVTLVKLGCELHEPYDQMVINSSQVTFWENLQDGGQVAKAVASFEKQNPNGLKCTDQSSSSSTTSGNAAQNAGNSSNSNSSSNSSNSSSSSSNSGR